MIYGRPPARRASHGFARGPRAGPTPPQPRSAGNTFRAPGCIDHRTPQPRTRGEHVIDRRSTASARTPQPRTRGEHVRTMLDRRRQSASAPHARGTHQRGSQCLCVGIRLSPARAGNTARERCHGRGIGASAPHARGTPVAAIEHARRHRLSPARAGNTLPATSCDICNISSAVEPPTRHLSSLGLLQAGRSRRIGMHRGPGIGTSRTPQDR